MTSKEMREYSVKNKTKIQSQLDTAPEFDVLPFAGKRVGHGFASFKEYINRQGRPRAEDPKTDETDRNEKQERLNAWQEFSHVIKTNNESLEGEPQKIHFRTPEEIEVL